MTRGDLSVISRNWGRSAVRPVRAAPPKAGVTVQPWAAAYFRQRQTLPW